MTQVALELFFDYRDCEYVYFIYKVLHLSSDKNVISVNDVASVSDNINDKINVIESLEETEKTLRGEIIDKKNVIKSLRIIIENKDLNIDIMKTETVELRCLAEKTQNELTNSVSESMLKLSRSN